MKTKPTLPDFYWCRQHGELLIRETYEEVENDPAYTWHEGYSTQPAQPTINECYCCKLQKSTPIRVDKLDANICLACIASVMAEISDKKLSQQPAQPAGTPTFTQQLALDERQRLVEKVNDLKMKNTGLKQQVEALTESLNAWRRGYGMED